MTIQPNQLEVGVGLSPLTQNALISIATSAASARHRRDDGPVSHFNKRASAAARGSTA
jgi:hypothetical protein